MTDREEINIRVAKHVAEGGWSSIYALIADMSDEDIMYRFYYLLNNICDECGNEFEEAKLDECGLCYDCAFKIGQ